MIDSAIATEWGWLLLANRNVGPYIVRVVKHLVAVLTPKTHPDHFVITTHFGNLSFTGKNDDGTYSYVNWSYQNPYSYLTDAPLAVLSGADEKTINEKLIDAAAEMVRPFTSEQIFAKAYTDVMRNQTDTGRQVYNPEDPDKWQKIFGHLAESIEPGTSTRLRERIIPALKDEQPDYGRKLDPVAEILAEGGMKEQHFSFDQAIQYRVREFSRSESNAEYLFKLPATKQGTVSEEDLFKAYQESDAARFKIWQRFHGDIVAARRNGVSEASIEDYLKIGKIGQDDIAALLDGEYVPLHISDEAFDKMTDLGRGSVLERIEKYRESVMDKPLAK